MDLGESAFLSDAGVLVERGQGFELTSGFNVDLTFGLDNWPLPPPTFFIDAGDRFRVTAFAALRDQLPVSLGEIASRLGFLGGSLENAEIETLSASATAQFASGPSRLTLDDLNSAAFDVLAGATGILEGVLPFATGAGLEEDVDDGDIELGEAGANFLAAALEVGLPDSAGNFVVATPNELLRMLGQLGEWLGALSTSEILDLTIPFAGSTTLGDVLDRLGIPRAETKLCFVNGRQRDLDHCVCADDEVGLFPPIAGGSGY